MIERKTLSLYQEIKDESGFTLVELLVVILIIGILASIAVPVFLGQRKKALDTQLRSDMKTVALWMETSKLEDGSPYPRMAKNWRSGNGTSTTYSNWPSDLIIGESTGIITSDSSAFLGFFGGKAQKIGAGFCIEGQVQNGTFDLTNPTTQYRLYYNSMKGGFASSCSVN